jgi:4-amino-4-deoxy-L-arabinose transferase-like glycosyltransferase
MRTDPFCANVRCWREWEFWLVALAGVLLFGTRLTALPIRGEETRRAEVACEILQTGDWIVPRQQGQPFLSRPPLGSYPIALAAIALGDCSLAAVRLPTVLATWLTLLLIYAYGRLFLSRLGALSAALAYGTMGQVLLLGRLAETEATFTLLLSGAMLTWHWGYSRSWRQPWPWCTGYGLAAFAALAKGPQAPVYFAASVCLYLACRRDWQTLFSRGHLAGIALFAVVVGAWQIPFWIATDWTSVRAMWLGDVAMRFDDTSRQTMLVHLLTYPLEIVVSTLPWSPLLLAFVSPRLGRSLENARPFVGFLALSFALAFASCWFVPGAKPRYLMPVYPCLALMLGWCIERVEAPAGARERRGWSLFMQTIASTAILAAILVVANYWVVPSKLAALRQSGWFAGFFAAASAAAAILLIRARRSFGQTTSRIALLTIAGWFGLLFVGLILNVSVATACNPAPDVARLKEKLPAGTHLVSFGEVETLFTYLYRRPVELRAWPPSANECSPNDFFCFTWDRPVLPTFPFAWRVEGTIPCDRILHNPALKRVIVGRRIDLMADRSRQVVR